VTRPSGTEGIASFIVDRDSAGLRVGKHEDRCANAPATRHRSLRGREGEKENPAAPEGEGFKLAMETFNQTVPTLARWRRV
jgi:acyl-CoA dehydrogenase